MCFVIFAPDEYDYQIKDILDFHLLTTQPDFTQGREGVQSHN